MRFTQKQRPVFVVLSVVGLFASSRLLAQQVDELFNKVMQNDIEAVKELIASGADINQQNEMYGHTPLIIACNYDYVELAIFLMSEGADVNIQGKDGSTALIAAGSNSQELVELLLSKGADVHAKMTNGTGVFTQCINGILMDRISIQLAKTLVAKGIDVDESATSGPAEGYTPLMTAARNNKLELVSFLIENGANVNAKGNDGTTALSLAVKKAHQDIIDVLKSNGAK